MAEQLSRQCQTTHG